MRFIYLFVFLNVSGFVAGQNRLLDSLTASLKNHSQKDTIRVAILNELSLRTLKNQPEKSLDYAQQALATAQQIQFQKGIGEAKNNLAVYQLMRGNTEASLEFALEAVRIGEREHLTESLANSYAVLGTIYHRQMELDKALLYLAKARRLNEKVNNILIASKIFNSLGGIARDKKNYDSSLFFYKKALSVMAAGDEKYRVSEVLANIGSIYLRENKNALALEYYLTALAAAKESDNRRSQARILSTLGGIYLSNKKYVEAEKLLQEGLKLSKEIGDQNILSGTYMFLGQLKNETGKFDDAHVYVSRVYELKDSLLNVERVKKIAELEIRYETEKKEHVIQLLEKDKRIQRLWTNILITVLVLLVIASILTYYLQRFREQKNRQILNLRIDFLTEENKELSEKYKDALTGGDIKSVESVDQRLLKKAIEVVENNMSDPLFGVEQMARELGMSRTNMHRKIKAITGFPPSELIRNIRLRKAAVLLRSQADNVSQISLSVGFVDHSYFSKSFKKQFGVTPSEYLQSTEQEN